MYQLDVICNKKMDMKINIVHNFCTQTWKTIIIGKSNNSVLCSESNSCMSGLTEYKYSNWMHFSHQAFYSYKYSSSPHWM